MMPLWLNCSSESHAVTLSALLWEEDRMKGVDSSWERTQVYLYDRVDHREGRKNKKDEVLLCQRKNIHDPT